MLDYSKLCGVGLRSCHYDYWHNQNELPLFEILADNFMFYDGGPALYHLKKIIEKSQVVVHCVGMNIATAWDFDLEYCYKLKKFIHSLNPITVSDHLCFTGSPSHNSYDLLPIPYTNETLLLLSERIDIIQNILGRQFSLENISNYVSYNDNTYTELEFINELCKRTGCGILLDINNVFVSSINHGFNPIFELKKLNPIYVTQFHIAGHSKMDDFLFDTHDRKVCSEVWSLLRSALELIGKRPLIIERDDEECPIEELMHDLKYARENICI